MGLAMSVKVEGLPPDLYEKFFGVKPQKGARIAGTAQAYAEEKIRTDKWRWTTHPELTESGTCLRCMMFDGTVWEWGDLSAPAPPLHPNCVCTQDPYFEEGNPILEGEEPEPPMLLGEALEDELPKMSPSQVAEMIGVRLSRLMRLGKIEPSDLYERGRGLKTTEEILGDYFGLTMGELDKMTDAQVRALRRR